MGQVPAGKNKTSSILIVGNGRLASALTQILTANSDTFIFERWSRNSSTSFEQALEQINATHVWLAISDDAIVPFTTENQKFLRHRTVVHFSGSLPSFEFVHAAHPLTTFSTTSSSGSMSLDRFAEVPFVLDRTGPELSELMPGFKNPSYRIDPERRAYYHALCAISGNFTVLLWESVAAKFESDLQIPRSALANYRRQVFENLSRSGTDSVLTGPLVRGDVATIQKHRHALLTKNEMPLLKIYDGFVDLYRTSQSRNKPAGAK